MTTKTTYSGHRHHQRRSKNNSQKSTRTSDQVISIPLWEKEFIQKIGLFKWERFVKTKKALFPYEKPMNWDDSAGEEAFNMSKKLFWEKLHNFPTTVQLPDPDCYIDQIDWYSDLGNTLLVDLERFDDDDDDDDENPPSICYDEVPRDVEIIATGWEYQVEDARDLEGLIVGGD